MSEEKTINISEAIENEEYKYAWIHCYDRLDILTKEKLVELKTDETFLSNLVELKLFGAEKGKKEITFTKKDDQIARRKWPADVNEKSYAKSAEEDAKYIEEQQIISHDKIKNSGLSQISKKNSRYLLKICHEMAYESDGTAYIKDSHLVDIESRDLSKEMEV
jgi:hypothetical protein